MMHNSQDNPKQQKAGSVKSSPKQDQRREKLAKALRQNLLRRKQATTARNEP